MDLDHLKHAALTKHLQMHNGESRALRKDNVKDDNEYRVLLTAKFSGFNFKTSWYGRACERRSIRAHSSAHVRSSQIAEIPGETIPTSVDTTTTQDSTIGIHGCLPSLFVGGAAFPSSSFGNVLLSPPSCLWWCRFPIF